jgi:hypothetical protein
VVPDAVMTPPSAWVHGARPDRRASVSVGVLARPGGLWVIHRRTIAAQPGGESDLGFRVSVASFPARSAPSQLGHLPDGGAAVAAR